MQRPYRDFTFQVSKYQILEIREENLRKKAWKMKFEAYLNGLKLKLAKGELSSVTADSAFNYAWIQICNLPFIKIKSGGEGGIRTLDTIFQSYGGLANHCLQPLGHLSKDSL